MFRPLAILLLISLLAGAAPLAAQEAPTPAPVIPVAETTTATATIAAALPGWVSPTPDETGAIVVIVQPGESLWVIAARAGLALPDLLALNGLGESDIINPGDALIIGYATPEPPRSPEEGTATPTLPPPTLRPTETRAEAAICLIAYDDLDRDGVRDANEPLRAGVAFTIYNSQAVVANAITDGVSEPRCVRGLPPGDYRVTRSVVPGEVLTTAGDWTLSLSAGSELRQSFGSYAGAAESPSQGDGFVTAATASVTPATAPPRSPASSLGFAGVAVLFAGGLILLGAVLILLRRSSRRGPGGLPVEDEPAERHFRKIDDLE